MSWNVLLPQPIAQAAVDLLQGAGHRLVLAPECSKQAVAALLPEAEAIVLRTGIRLDRQLFAAASKLRTVSRTGAGVDNVDLVAATEYGVVVTSSLGVNTTSVAEHALALMLALAKRLPQLDAATRRGDFAIRYQSEAAKQPIDLHGKTLGLLGYGRIGSELARLCRASFAMRTLACDSYICQEAKEAAAGNVEFTDLDTLLRQADVFSIHVPLTDQTLGLIGERELQQLKPSALLINCSRGGIVDESALAAVLLAGRLAGAGLDVFSQEPPDLQSALLQRENLIVTPHTAALSSDCSQRMALAAVQRVIDQAGGQPPANVANPQVLAR